MLVTFTILIIINNTWNKLHRGSAAHAINAFINSAIKRVKLKIKPFHVDLKSFIIVKDDLNGFL